MTLSRLPGLRNHRIVWYGLTRGTHKPSRTAAVGIVSIAVYGLLPVKRCHLGGARPGVCENVANDFGVRVRFQVGLANRGMRPAAAGSDTDYRQWLACQLIRNTCYQIHNTP